MLVFAHYRFLLLKYLNLFYEQVSCGTSQSSSVNNDLYVDTNYQNNLLASMLESHLASDFCLIGPKGCGKSTTVRRLADLLGYQVEPIVLYQASLEHSLTNTMLHRNI